ncbi:MAG: 6,7-dimethyl-8-ribityllumazine synthase [Verrucomicrobiota bacterium]|jgi:6,7-dimethyl-8-ribityllumazine synthase
MSNQLPHRPESCDTPWRIGVVSSLYNQLWVNGLVLHFEREAKAICPKCELSFVQVPGSFELPLGAQLLADSGTVDALAVFGVLLEGETAHATLVAQAVTQGLMQISLAHRIPVIHEVLLVKNVEQAEKRCLEEEINRGLEAARACIRMLRNTQMINSLSNSRKA